LNTDDIIILYTDILRCKTGITKLYGLKCIRTI